MPLTPGRKRARSLHVLAWFIAAASCRPADPQAPLVALAADPDDRPRVGSNALRGDYAGSEVCGLCHDEIHERWSASPMHRMTRLATPDALRAPPDGRFAFKGGVFAMHEQDGARLATVSGPDGDKTYRLTRVIGGRFREDYAGVEIGPDGRELSPVEWIMPASYVLSTESFRYKGYSVLVKERPHLAVNARWRQTCIFCHNTVPYLSKNFDDLLDRRVRGYQGSSPRGLLPPDRRWNVEVADRAELASAVTAELRHLGAEAGDPDPAGLDALLERAIGETRARFSPEHFVELGIGCEACHGGAREHADDPELLPSFTVRGPAFGETVGAARREPTRALAITRSCARCHTSLFSRYPHTWEGGARRTGDPGGSPLNSGEARDFLLGDCWTQLSCTTCHDPHGPDDPAALAEMATPAGNRHCLPCHEELAGAGALAAHTRHDPAGAGSACLACHMAEKNIGLGYRLTRYHRIGKPNDAARVERDRPLECALCHADASVESLVETMEGWWGGRFDRRALARLYGDDLGAPALAATLSRGKPHEQVVALAVLGRRGDRSGAGKLAEHLAHPYPLVRYFAAQALADLVGSWPDVDLDADAAAIRRSTYRWLRELPARP